MSPTSLSPDIAAQIAQVEDSCICHSVRKAARVVTQAYDAALAPAGIRGTQFTLLAAIAGMQPVSMNDLAARVVMDRTTLTRNLVPLLEAGLIVSRSGSDRRRREIELTDAGRGKLVEAFRLWLKVQSEMTETLGERRTASLLRNLSETVSLVGDR
jgi:DNA-binding MarR family transcriptional regulator